MRMLEGAEIGYITHVNTMQPSYFVGLDLAQSQDYSALVILERRGLARKLTDSIANILNAGSCERVTRKLFLMSSNL
jgi:hypothetical protein